MNAPQEPAPEPMEDAVSPELRDDLRSLFGARVTVPPSVDESKGVPAQVLVPSHS